MSPTDLLALARLIRSQRSAALGTLHDGAPYVSHALYLPADDFGAFYFHLSRLAIHTKNLLADPRAGLMIAEPDTGASDPQLLLRLSLQGQAAPLAPDAPDHADLRARYLARFPEAAMMLQLSDFALFRFTPRDGRFVAGFGKAFNITLANLKAAAVANSLD